jgi:hypothetical protein
MIAHKRQFSTWLAILAILLNALMPTVSLAFDTADAVSTSAEGEWVEMCSASGSAWLLLDANGQLLARSTQKPEGALASSHEGHCPYCLTHAASFGLAPTSATQAMAWPVLADRLAQPAAPRQKQQTWLTPAARAPPHRMQPA